MLLPVCKNCSYGGVKNNMSHCSKEACYSYLSKCIQRKALENYFERYSTEGSMAGEAALRF